MRRAFVVLAAVAAMVAVSACQSEGGYDGVSRFADTGGVVGAYYGPGSPPRDFGDGSPT